MTLNQLMATAASVYPDGYILQYWDTEREMPRYNPNGGDTLAQFIATELADTFDPEADDSTQIATACKAMLTARDQLEQVMLALSDLAVETAERKAA